MTRTISETDTLSQLHTPGAGETQDLPSQLVTLTNEEYNTKTESAKQVKLERFWMPFDWAWA